MTVLSYLTNIASEAVISEAEKKSIQTSISTIHDRIGYYLQNNVSQKLIFGSYSRGTILPRSMDEHSDIDYMVVFSDDGLKPQSYLDRLRKFVEYYYSSSEINQSHPTIQLNLNHIRFELVPAIKLWGDTYKIPSKQYNDWIDTNPIEFNRALTEKNKNHRDLIKPLVRLVKYWNSKNNYIFESFALEKFIINNIYFSIFCTDLKEYFFKVFDEMGDANLSIANKNKVNRAKSIITEVRNLEKDNFIYLAEKEIKELI